MVEIVVSVVTGYAAYLPAERLGVSRQTVNAIETGKYDPSLPLAFRIARLFGTAIEAGLFPEVGFVECGYCDRRFVIEGGPADSKAA